MKRQWETEKKQLLGEKAALQDAAKRLNMQIRNTKEDAKTERAKAGGQEVSCRTVNLTCVDDVLSFLQELEKAKRVIADLENDLQVERSRLRSLSTEQNRIQRQKDEVVLQLQRTESVGICQNYWAISC